MLISDWIALDQGNHCHICDREVTDKCRIENCCHRFCFSCLYDWVQQFPNNYRIYCPQCLAAFSIIQYNYESEERFNRHPILSFKLYSMVRQQILSAEQVFLRNPNPNTFETFSKSVEKLSKILGLLNIISNAITDEEVIHKSLKTIEKSLIFGQIVNHSIDSNKEDIIALVPRQRTTWMFIQQCSHLAWIVIKLLSLLAITLLIFKKGVNYFEYENKN